MSWKLKWSHAAIFALRAMPWRHAARVDAAVMDFAATGHGDLVRADDSSLDARLRVGSYVVNLTFDPLGRVIHVRYVYSVSSRLLEEGNESTPPEMQINWRSVASGRGGPVAEDHPEMAAFDR